MSSVAIVTGASSGIGRATAVRLSREFAAVVLVAREGDKLEEVAGSVDRNGSKGLVVALDLSVPAAAETVIRTTLEHFGRIDALVNIAGAVAALDVFQMSDELWESAMSLKFHADRRLTIQAWDALKAANGSVIFTSGNAAAMPKAATAAVAAINAAIEALAKAFAERGIADGIQVNSISPGAVITARRLAMLAKVAGEKQISLDEAQQRFLQQAGISRFGQPEEIADLIAFATSPAARWLTGTVLRMDGGEIKTN
jgi:3-oxoacyl-[acyl-carrier protein] reductase